MSDTRLDSERRHFLVSSVHACALACVAASGVQTLLAAGGQAASQAAGQGPAGPKHKFDGDFAGKLTNRQVIRMQYGSAFIPLVRVMKQSLGPERTLALVGELSTQGVKEQAEAVAKRLGSRDLGTIKRMFSAPELSSMWTVETVEDNETRYRIRVTECLWADVFKQANLGEEGHAAICMRDFALARELNPGIELTRDKTLMQGHDCCNHCYQVKAG